jgi:hypothetical protein
MRQALAAEESDKAYWASHWLARTAESPKRHRALENRPPKDASGSTFVHNFGQFYLNRRRL